MREHRHHPFWDHPAHAGPHGRGGGFGHGRGGPFGRHRGGPFGSGRGSRMFDSGALRLVVLGLIAEEPRHGYDIIKALEARFQGTYSPSPGAIYPMLQMLEEADLVSSETTGKKRLYSITQEGQAYLDENKADLDRINDQLDEASGQMQGAAAGQEMRALRDVLFRKLRGGEMTTETAREAVEIIRRARTDIENL